METSGQVAGSSSDSAAEERAKSKIHANQESDAPEGALDEAAVAARAAAKAEAERRAEAARQLLPKDRVRDLSPRKPAEINLRTLLEAGVHFGHQTSRWNPAMRSLIHSTRNGIHIINLPKTVQAWEAARKAILDVSAKGGSVLFVGTKKQAQDAIADEAQRCGAFHVTQRWLGGMLTNFQTIRRSIERMKKIETILTEESQAIAGGQTPEFNKKERLMMSRERDKLDFSLGGIRDMHGAPALMFVVDIRREDIAIKEARKLDIPVVALVDTNCDPNEINFPIPSNDDGTRAIRLFCEAVADAVMEGRRIYKETGPTISEADFAKGKKKNDRGPRKGKSRRSPSREKAKDAEAGNPGDDSVEVQANENGESKVDDKAVPASVEATDVSS